MTALILLAHGSPDPRAAHGVRALAHATSVRSGLEVLVAFLDHAKPDLTVAARDLAAEGVESAIVVPLFLTEAYHAQVDVPRAVAEAQRSSGLALDVTPALGVSGGLLEAVASSVPAGPIVLAATGTRDATGLAQLRSVGDRLARLCGHEVLVGFVSAAGPTVVEAIGELEASTRQPVNVVSLVLFEGVIHDRIREAAGHRRVTQPLSSFDALVEAVLARATVGVGA